MQKVIIKQDFHDFLNGKEVEAAFVSRQPHSVWPGEHVLVFKDAAAATSDLPAPTADFSTAIGIEGTVTQVQHSKAAEQEQIQTPVIKIIKR